jgi:hypothetical protein
MSCLRRGHDKIAGVATALSGMARIFPLVWMFGPGVTWLSRCLSAEKGRRMKAALGASAVLVAFALTLGVTSALSLASVGEEAVVDHASKMAAHTSADRISSKRPGLAIALSYNGEIKRHRMSDGQRDRIEDRKPLMYGIALLVMAALGWALRRRPAHEAYAFGYVPFFLLTTGTYYYHVARLTLVLLHASNLEKLQHRVGLAILFALEVHSHLMFVYFKDQEVFWTGWLSWGLCAYIVTMIGFGLHAVRKQPSETRGRLG